MKILLFIGLLLYFSSILHWFLVDKFDISRSFRLKTVSVFLVLSIWGSILGSLVLFFNFSSRIVWVSAALMFVLSVFFKVFTKKDIFGIRPEIDDESKVVVEEWPTPLWSVVLFFLLLVSGFLVLSQNSSVLPLVSPWQAISRFYILVFFIITLLTGCLIFTRFKSATILGVLVLYTFLLHSYLPLSSQLFFGADGWRHIAIDNQLLDNGKNGVVVSSQQLLSFWQNFDFGSLAYSQFSGLALLFKYFVNLDFVDFIRFFIPFVWSLVFPVVLFEIGRALNFTKKNSLFLVWLSALPFALQVSGSFSLPSNLGFLIFSCLLLFIFKNNFNKSLNLSFFLPFSLLFVFGYSLYFILFWILFLLKLVSKKSAASWLSFLVTFILSFSLPAIEIFTNFSSFSSNISFLSSFKKIIINLLSVIPSFGLLPYDTSAGNIIFNQPPLNTIFNNPFLIFKPGIWLFMVAFWVFVFYTFFKFLKEKNTNQILVLQFFSVIFTGYIVSRYFLVGENIFTRRLDALLAMFLIIFLSFSVFKFLISDVKKASKIKIFFSVLVFSIFICVSYTLGPDSQSVGNDQYLAMQNVWNRSKNEVGHRCVLADQYSLLTLEAYSGKQIVGGGFPINSYFAQPEYVEILKESFSDPILAINKSKQLLKTDSCYLVGEYDLPDPLAKINNISIYKF